MMERKLSDERLAEIRGRLSKATPGPWRLELEDGEKESQITTSDTSVIWEPIAVIPHDDITDKGWRQVKANARFIARSPTDMADLLASHDALAVDNARLRELVVGYSDAVATMNAAMKDEVNVHGALSAIVGYESEIDELRSAAVQPAKGEG